MYELYSHNNRITPVSREQFVSTFAALREAAQEILGNDHSFQLYAMEREGATSHYRPRTLATVADITEPEWKKCSNIVACFWSNTEITNNAHRQFSISLDRIKEPKNLQVMALPSDLPALRQATRHEFVRTLLVQLRKSTL